MEIRMVLDELIKFQFKFETNCESSTFVSGFASYPPGEDNCISMWRGSEIPVLLPAAKPNQVIICVSELGLKFAELGYQFISTTNPRSAFCVIGNLFDDSKDSLLLQETYISSSARIGENTFVGIGTVLGNVEIGNNCKIGNNTVIHSKTKIGNGVEIGDNCTIGASGFGYERIPSGKLMRIPHLGGVTIGNDVHIGCNTSIDRGTINDTVIGSNSKIDNLVHIAHNVVIGEEVFIVAGAEISGSVNIANGAWIAPQASIRQKLSIGAKSIVGIGSVVIRDVDDETTVAGVPAKPLDKI
jgi:UDP-3-O-[3-hydroxymyristoyl] glucosamine N-acyltransferase